MHKVVINTCYGSFGLSKEAINWLKERYPDFFNSPMKRHDPRLVECVETLEEKADARFAELQVKEIEGNIYRIEEYDGKEEIVVPDDLEWIVIDSDE